MAAPSPRDSFETIMHHAGRGKYNAFARVEASKGEKATIHYIIEPSLLGAPTRTRAFHSLF